MKPKWSRSLNELQILNLKMEYRDSISLKGRGGDMSCWPAIYEPSIKGMPDQGCPTLPSGNVTVLDQVIDNLPGYLNIPISSVTTGMQTFMCSCWGRVKIHTTLQGTFSDIFHYIKFMYFYWNFTAIYCPIDSKPALSPVKVWNPKHWWLSLLAYACVSLSRWAIRE